MVYIIDRRCSFILFLLSLSPTEGLLGPAVLVVSGMQPGPHLE